MSKSAASTQFTAQLTPSLSLSLHGQWIRERCKCALCVHLTSLQPLADLSHPDTDPKATSVVSHTIITHPTSTSTDPTLTSTDPTSTSTDPTLTSTDPTSTPPPLDSDQSHRSCDADDGDDDDYPLLKVTFEDGHTVCLPIAQIVAEHSSFSSVGALQASATDVSLPPLALWDASFAPSIPHVQYQDLDVGMTPNGVAQHLQPSALASRKTLLHALLTRGLVIVDDVPCVESELVRMCENLVGYVRETSWGKIFDVKAVPRGDDGSGMFDQASTGGAIGFHVDNPYRVPPVDYQLLHCLKWVGGGEGEGVNRLVDAFLCAEKLKAEDPDAFAILASTGCKWENDGPHVAVAPIIQLDGEGNLVRVFLSGKSGGFAPLLPAQQLEAFYTAKRKLMALFEHKDHVVYHRLEPGQVLAFGNTRILHARTAYDDTVVDRHLQGLYLDHDAVTRAFWRVRHELQKGGGDGDQEKEEGGGGEKMKRPSWTCLTEATEEDVAVMNEAYAVDTAANQVPRVLAMLRAQKGAAMMLGAPIDLYEHGLQTATRAYNAGEEVDVVVAALLHDVGEVLSPSNHGDIAAALLDPYVSPAVSWMLSKHEVFQYYYYGQAGKREHDTRERWRGEPHFELTERFCRDYDQTGFDPGFESKELEFFVPMVEEVFARTPYWHTPDHPKFYREASAPSEAR